jgi:hypothetical protein
MAIAAVTATTAHADTIVFQSNLSAVTAPNGASAGLNFQIGLPGGVVPGITNTNVSPGVLGYNFVYAQGTPNGNTVATQSNTLGAYAGNGPTIKLASSVTADPFDTQDKGAFLALDSVYDTSAVDANFSTVAGQTYDFSFDWGATQQTLGLGQTSDYITVDLGSTVCKVTNTLTVAQQGFTGWNQVTGSCTAATTGSSFLSFLATGSSVLPGQQPAMVLLDNITVSTPPASQTPEPASLMLLSTGLVGLGGFVRSRYSKKS